MPKSAEFRKELLDYLERPRAHISLEKAVAGMPVGLMNRKPRGVPYTPWGLVEHIRITQRDMIDFMSDPDYRELEWPKAYWPDPVTSKADAKKWNKSVATIARDHHALIALARHPKRDLLAKIPWGDGQTSMREVMQIIDHTAYHTGELVLMRRMMGAWKHE